MLDLLSDRLIGVRRADGTQDFLSLPAVIAGLMADRIEDFTGLRAHQVDVWHVLLVQLAASVMARQPEGAEIPDDEQFWRAGLLDLSDGLPSAWHLVTEEVTEPAFLQHPLRSAADFKAFKLAAQNPDELDVLVTSKNHDVKGARIPGAAHEAWLFALVTLQTTSGFLGAGNYGSIRMNGGFGSRCVVSLVSSIRPANRFREELRSLIQMRSTVLGSALPYRSRGVVLTWLSPWDRSGPHHALEDLEPWFVESVRPVRLRRSTDGLAAMTATSGARQIGPKAIVNGDVGDPWIPINEGVAQKAKSAPDRSALTVSASGWTPQRLSDLVLQQGFQLTALQKPRAGLDRQAWFIASVLARNKGKTEGFHRTVIPVPASALALLGSPTERARIARAAAQLREDASEVQRTLSMALVVLASGGPETVKSVSDVLTAWAKACLGRFTRGWSERYFDALWRLVDTPIDDVRCDWQASLVLQARKTLIEAEARLPTPTGRRWRGRVNASSLLNASLKKKGLLGSEGPNSVPRMSNVLQGEENEPAT